MLRLASIALLLGGLLFLSSCADSAHQLLRHGVWINVPPELKQQIDTTVTFSDLQANPANYTGRVVMFDGVVIKARRTAEQTEIELLQLPADENEPSTSSRLGSKGRFLALREEFLDPATVPPSTPLTIIGVVRGSETRALDESEYTYPVLEIKHLVDWSSANSRSYGSAYGSYYGPYYGPYYSPFSYWWGPYGGYYPYGWGYYPYAFRPRPPVSLPPKVSPQFRKRR